ncbi:MAG: hypothetical protein F4Z75_00990 [Synechococcus sp. SB0668_bin_15]|nr:hypothetical protein [Synechococcus sp. SB0668_bin_15]MXZ83218.1 hypothetical protein [Synechococcus sp. SB0666_bin_14]MYC48769.1 hypothetical protein [Synechococcus sp. SB0662_bin_14]MYG45924.1 hypothetical protein [Synechococcus sp. SB0675_bin_6]MYJ59794.1 hypothetical protein [Synechococcus sp. SB0672_bin_6]MYK91507.1 hypothetical protein [Synechococcus sp. SB0669_bin_8]
MTTKDSERIYYDVGLTPEQDAQMKAMAERIGGDQRHVFAYGMDLYYRVKGQLLDRGGGELFIKFPDGNVSTVQVR